MEQQPLVSVLMTVYNREKYIAEAIESVINSSYQNWELIIVDDQSKDRSVEIARSYEAKDTRIRVYVNEVNLGDYPNRNKAASYAKGKYLKYLDSDDIIYPHGLEVMVSAMEKFPEAGMGVSDLNNKGEQSYPYLVDSYNCYLTHFFGASFLYHGPTGCIYNTDIFNSIKGFDIEYGVATDLDYNLKLAMKYPVVIFNRDLYWWRPHFDQEINKKKMEYETLTFLIFSKYLKRIDNPLGQKSNVAYHNIIAIKTRKIIKLMLNLKLKQAWQMHKSLTIKTKHYILALLPSKLIAKL